MQSKKEMPLEHKPIITIREASFYTGISEKKLIEITNLYACPFVLWMGNRRFIKRKAFEKFIQTSEFKHSHLVSDWFALQRFSSWRDRHDGAYFVLHF